MRALVRTFSALLISAAVAGGSTHAVEPSPLDAVVQVQAVVPGDARTAGTLGTQREGAGAIIDSSGLVLTIGYLILEASEVSIGLYDGRTLPAAVIAYDHESGFGLVRTLTPPDVRPLRLGDSGKVGESYDAIVAGFEGAPNAIPAKVVSRRPFAGYWEYLLEDAIFTEPPYSGFGGAALLDPDGRLIGIGSLFVGDARGADIRSPGNMFVPINELKPILGDLLESGRRASASKPWLGLISADLQGHLVVRRASPDGPASRAGIQGRHPGGRYPGIGRRQADFGDGGFLPQSLVSGSGRVADQVAGSASGCRPRGRSGPVDGPARLAQVTPGELASRSVASAGSSSGRASRIAR